MPTTRALRASMAIAGVAALLSGCARTAGSSSPGAEDGSLRRMARAVEVTRSGIEQAATFLADSGVAPTVASMTIDACNDFATASQTSATGRFGGNVDIDTDALAATLAAAKWRPRTTESPSDEIVSFERDDVVLTVRLDRDESFALLTASGPCLDHSEDEHELYQQLLTWQLDVPSGSSTPPGTT